MPLGEEHAGRSYRAQRGSEPVTGIAAYNVTPDQGRQLFPQAACFCFNRAALGAGREPDMAVQLLGRSRDRQGPRHRDIHTITLSYTFFRTLDDAAKPARAQAGRPRSADRQTP